MTEGKKRKEPSSFRTTAGKRDSPPPVRAEREGKEKASTLLLLLFTKEGGKKGRNSRLSKERGKAAILILQKFLCLGGKSFCRKLAFDSQGGKGQNLFDALPGEQEKKKEERSSLIHGHRKGGESATCGRKRGEKGGVYPYLKEGGRTLP